VWEERERERERAKKAARLLTWKQPVTGVIKSEIIRWVGYVASMGEMVRKKFSSENVKRRNHVEDLDVDRKIILEGILRKR
jgi:hypothetical protein